jgi:hypothetical protein
VDKSGAAAPPTVVDSPGENGIAFQGVGAVAVLNEEIGKAFDEPGDAAAGGLDFDGNADGVAVVLDEKEDGQLAGAGGVEGFVELPLAGAAVAAGGVDDLVLLEADSFGLGGLGELLEVETGLSTTDGLQPLGAGAG